MKYNRLHINQFGKLQNRTLNFTDGVNIIRSDSESDRTALHTFLEVMQYGMDIDQGCEGSSQIYSQFCPEEGRSTYGGVLEFTKNEHTYSIFRNFHRDPRGLTLMDQTSNRALPLSKEDYQELIRYMPLALYRDTIAIEQLPGDTTEEMADSLHRHILNLKTSGSAVLDLSTARDHLNQELQFRQDRYDTAAEEHFQELDDKIRDLEKEKDELPPISDLPQCEEEGERLQKEILQLEQRQHELSQSIRTHEGILREHSRGAEGTLKETEDRCQRLLSRREKLLKHYPEPSTSVISRLSPMLTILLILLSLFGLFFGAYQLIFSNLTVGIPSVLAGLLALSRVPSMIQQWRAKKAFHSVDTSLNKLYREVMTDAPDYVTSDNLKDFLDMMQELKSHRRQLAQCRKEIQSLTPILDERRKQSQRIQAFILEKKKDILRKQKLEEAICQCIESQEALEPALQMNQKLKEEMDAIHEAMHTIERLSTEAFRGFSAHLQTTGSEILSQITGARCSDLTFSEDMPITICQEGTVRELSELDGGTLEIIFLSLRIACIRFFWPGEEIPLLLNEAFLRYSDLAIAEVFGWLAASYSGQVFLLTCRSRQGQILKDSGIPYNDITL